MAVATITATVVAIMATMAITAITVTRALAAAFGAAMMLAGCDHPPPSHAARQVSPRNLAAARQEIKLGVRAYGHHAYKVALGHFNHALKFDPASVEARYDRGITSEQLGAYKGGEADLAYVVQQQPKWSGARLHLAAAQFRAHHFADSARNFDLALGSNDKSWKLWLDDGVSYYRLQRYADARKRFARALALSPRSGRAHFWLGLTYRHFGKAYAAKARNELALAAHSRDLVVRRAARSQLGAR